MAPERITVTVDRYGEPIVFGADLTERARANGCTVVDYVRADLGMAALAKEVAPMAMQLAEAVKALRECARLSGADLSDGFPTWPDLPTFAVRCVRELREDYDAAGEP